VLLIGTVFNNNAGNHFRAGNSSGTASTVQMFFLYPAGRSWEELSYKKYGVGVLYVPT
jgi:hypothetical protein